MKLTDLHGGFIQDPEKGLMLALRCPLCEKHHVGVPVTVGQKVIGRWKVTSMDINTLTLEPSVLHNWPKETPAELKCQYHFNVTNGEVINC